MRFGVLLFNRPKNETKGSEEVVNTDMLKGIYISRGFSQRSLAKATGINKNTLNSKINNKGYFNTQEIEKICKVLNLTDDNDKAKIFLWQPSQK